MRHALPATAMAVGLLLQATAFAQSAEPTVAEVEKFLKEAEAALSAESVRVNRIQWVNSTYLTEDTDALAAEAGYEGDVAGALDWQVLPGPAVRREEASRC